MRMKKSTQGFSLVELMISMVASLIVVGSVLAFTMATLRSNTENIQATRLQQELRTALDLVARDIRRAGFDRNAVRSVAEGTAFVSPFAPFFVSAAGNPTCVVYAYDRATGTAGVIDAGELRAFRRVVLANGRGAIETYVGNASPVNCGAASADYSTIPATCTAGWCPVTDPTLFDVTAFTVTDNSATEAVGTVTLRIPEFAIRIDGRLPDDTVTARSVSITVKPRADCIRATLAACQAAPAI
jgi:Tfp pilus assembly protein PilW